MRLTCRECALWGTVGADARIRPRGVGDAAPLQNGCTVSSRLWETCGPGMPGPYRAMNIQERK